MRKVLKFEEQKVKWEFSCLHFDGKSILLHNFCTFYAHTANKLNLHFIASSFSIILIFFCCIVNTALYSKAIKFR